jgi:hypothetical protein
MPPQFQSYFNNFMKSFYTPFIYKDYHINLGGPNGDHVRAATIFEDALPPADIYSSYKTLRERNGLCEYVRGTFIKSDEGELVDFSGGPKSLNSRLKLIELNPYNTNIYSTNPYKGLPKNLLIYKSCYPIVYDKESSLTQCNKTSTGINVRVYKLGMKEFISKYYNSGAQITKMGLNEDTKKMFKRISLELEKPENTIDTNSLKPYNFDVWREIIYYQWIRDKINRQNICPNFVSSYCYFINSNANLSFRRNGLSADTNKTTSELLDTEFTNCTMILLTESPNQNIFQWGSNMYTEERGIRKMTHSGYKPESNWFSVIAQILIVFYIMNKYCFTIREMDTNSCFYIKDLNIHGDVKQYWQYTIGNIDYYIPNFGHLVMFDHNYKDLTKSENISPMKHKIIMKDELGDDSNEINKTILSNAINCFNSNNFSSSFLADGGVGLSSLVINYLDLIRQDLINIEEKIKLGEINWTEEWNIITRKYLMKYIHNRVGTPIRDLEINYVKKIETRPRPFKIGELVIWEEKFETYKILLFVKNISETLCNCISKLPDTENYEEIDIPKDLLYHYSEFETIKQDGKLGEPIIGYEHILERYIF